MTDQELTAYLYKHNLSPFEGCKVMMERLFEAVDAAIIYRTAWITGERETDLSPKQAAILTEWKR